MKVFSIVKRLEYSLVAILSAAIMTLVYIYTQNFGNWNNVSLWINVMPWYNKILFPIFVALFGITMAYQVYLWRQPKSCPIGQKAKGAGTSSVATISAFFVAQCPACASLGTILLPASVAIYLVGFGWAINLVSIGLMLFTLNYLGGFDKRG